MRYAVKRAGIANGISSAMYNRFKLQGGEAPLVRLAKHILYRAVLVFQANLCLMRIGVVSMYGVSVRVQIQQKGIRYHGPAEEQEQEQGDIFQEGLHLFIETEANVQ